MIYYCCNNKLKKCNNSSEITTNKKHTLNSTRVLVFWDYFLIRLLCWFSHVITDSSLEPVMFSNIFWSCITIVWIFKFPLLLFWMTLCITSYQHLIWVSLTDLKKKHVYKKSRVSKFRASKLYEQCFQLKTSNFFFFLNSHTLL